MTCPPSKSIALGNAFVCVGLAKAMTDRWLREIKVQGDPSKSRTTHKFEHMFLIWFIAQLLQWGLLLLHKAIQNNWLGFSHFKHGEPEPRRLNQQMDNRPLRNFAGIQDQDDDQEENEQDQNNEGEGGPNMQLKNRRKKPSWLIYFPAALFAQAHILLLQFGLNLTYGSSFMMLKGTVTFFTALLSMAFLAQQLACHVWFGVIVTTLGFAASGISDYIHVPSGGYEKYGIAAGDLLIVMAQIMFATKIIYEEKFIRKHSIHPLVFLGSEACYGFFFAGILLIVFNFVDAVQYSNLPNKRLEDVSDAFYQLRHSWEASVAMTVSDHLRGLVWATWLLISVLLSCSRGFHLWAWNFSLFYIVLASLISYILYTYLGLFLIREHGALARIMIETFVWLLYWAICLALHWETFFIAQVPGLCVIVIGSLIYSHILLIPFVSRTDEDNADLQDFDPHAVQGNRLRRRDDEEMIGADDRLRELIDELPDNDVQNPQEPADDDDNDDDDEPLIRG